MNVKDILNEQFKDVITAETLTAVEEAFTQAVNEKAASAIELEKENLKNQLNEEFDLKIQSIDEDHTNKLKKLVEAIDTDHAVKLHKLIKTIDEKHTGMLKQVVEKYEGKLANEAKEFQTRFVEEVSNYLDLYLEKTIPTEQVAEAVENIRAAKQLAQIRKIVGINEDFVTTEIKEALVDGKKTIDSLKEELNLALQENVALKNRAVKAESTILLEKKTADMPEAKKKFVEKLLSAKDPEYIEENFSYVVEMFDKEALEKTESAKEEVKGTTGTLKVDRPEILEEEKKFTNDEIERSPSSEGVSGYLNELKGLSKYTR